METLNKKQSTKKGNKTTFEPLPQLQAINIPEVTVEPLPTIEPVNLPSNDDELGIMLNQLFAQPSVKVRTITKRQILNGAISGEVMGLGSWYSAIRKDEKNTLAFLEDQKSKGKKIDPSKVRILLYPEKNEGFELFRKYRNEKEQSLPKFTANQATGIFLRACLVD